MWFGPDNCSRDNPTAKPKHFARRQHRAAPACPRQALPSFRVEMAYAEVFFCYRNSSSETGLHPTRAVSPAASTLRPAVLRIVTVTGASFCGSVTS